MDNFARWTLLVLLVVALLGDGTNDDWAGGAVQCGCFLVLVLSLQKERGDFLHQLYTVPGFVFLVGLSFFFLLQLLPLPPILIELVSPATFRLYGDTIWMILPGCWMPLTLVPKATLGGFFLFISCTALFVSTIQLVPSLELSKKALGILAVGAGLFSLFGMIRLLLWPSQPQGFVVDGGQSSIPLFWDVVSCDYPTLMAMFLAPIVGLFFALQSRSKDFGVLDLRMGPWSLSPKLLQIYIGLSILLVLGSLLLSRHSWMLLINLCGLLLFASLVLMRGGNLRRGIILAVISMFFLMGVVFLRVGGGLESPGPGSGRSSSVKVVSEWEDGLEIFRQFPVAGTGFGTSLSLVDPSVVGNGGARHSVVGQSNLGRQLAEGGIVGAALFTGFLYAVFSKCMQAWLRRKSRTSNYLFSGVLAGIVVFFVYSLIDRTLPPLPLGVYFFFSLGLLVSVSHSRSRSHEVKNELSHLSPSIQKWALVAGAAFGIALITFHAGVGMARIAEGRISGAEASGDSSEPFDPLPKASQFSARVDPLESHYPLALGEEAWGQADRTLALEYFSSALRLNPLSSEALQKIGMVLSTAGEDTRTEMLLRAAAEYHPGNAKHQKDYALWLCSQSRYEDSFPYLQRSFELLPEGAGELLLLMSACGLEDEDMQSALGENPAAWVGYGDLLLGRGAEEGAEASYVSAAEFAAAGKTSLELPFLRLYEFYSERGRLQDALDAVLRGIETFPNDPRFRLAAGTLYQQLGIVYRAIEEYRKTLLLDPGNELAGLGLRELTLGR